MKKTLAVILAAGMLAACVSGNVLAEESENYAIFGLLTENGYENSYFGFGCEVPSEYVFSTRSILVPTNVQERAEVVADSNSEDTLSWLKSQFGLGYVEVFSATMDADSMIVGLQAPGFGFDVWEDAETVVDGSIDQTYENLMSVNSEEITVADLKVEKAQIEFMGETEWGIEYTCTLNGIPCYGKSVFMVSDDQKYLITVEVTSLDEQQAGNMLGYFRKL